MHSLPRRLGARLVGGAAALVATAALLVAAPGSASAACPPAGCAQITAPLGTAVLWDGDPHVFVLGADQHVWARRMDGPRWSWHDLGQPPGNRRIHWSAGAVGVNHQRAQLFVKTWYGDMWMLEWNPDQGTAPNRGITWTNHGYPAAGVYYNRGIGVVAADEAREGGRVFANTYAFVEGSDGNLWTRWWNGTVWSWTNLGLPATPPGNARGIAAPVGVVAAGAGTVSAGGGRYPHAFVKGKDGELYLASLGATRWTWTAHGRAVGAWLDSGYGAASAEGLPSAFFKGTDGNLWVRSFNGTTWSTTNLGQPPTAPGFAPGIEASAGAAAVGVPTVTAVQPAAFLTGKDGHLWQLQRAHRGWLWTNHGRPPGMSISDAGYGTVVTHSGRFPHVFAKAGNGSLWQRAAPADGSGQWFWQNHGLPGS